MNFKINNLLKIGLLFLIIISPNIFLSFKSELPVFSSWYKVLFYWLFTGSIFLLPLVVIRPKYYFTFSILFLLLLPVELININLYKSFTSQGVIEAILQSNIKESLEFVSGIKIFVLWYLLVIVLYVWVLRKLPSKYVISFNFKKWLLLLNVFILSVVFIREYKISNTLHKENSIEEKLSFSVGNFISKFDNTFPLGILLKISREYFILNERAENNSLIKDFRFNSIKYKCKENSEIHILIIGESARRKNFGIYGYKRKTTPFLSEIKDSLIIFSDVYSNANLTSISLPIILTRAEPKNYEFKDKERSFLCALKEAGFNTYWISNQSSSRNPLSFDLKLNYKKVFNNSIRGDNDDYDGKLLPELMKIIKYKGEGKKKFIVMHTMGSHFKFTSRYPGEFEKFIPTMGKYDDYMDYGIEKKEEIINSYDNSILYTDWFVNSVINLLKKENAVGSVTFISDHATTLFDDDVTFLRSMSSTVKTDFMIPMFIYLTPEYRIVYKDETKNLLQNEDKKVSLINIFHSLPEMYGVSFEKLDKEKSFVDSCYKEHKIRRYIDSNLKIHRLD